MHPNILLLLMGEVFTEKSKE